MEGNRIAIPYKIQHCVWKHPKIIKEWKYLSGGGYKKDRQANEKIAHTHKKPREELKLFSAFETEAGRVLLCNKNDI